MMQGWQRRTAWSCGAAFLLALALAPARAEAAVGTFVADRDTSMFFAPGQEFSSGAGSFLYFGTIASGEPRRALLRFNVSSIPPGSTINSATLRITINRTPQSGSGEGTASLHRVLADWGEAASTSTGGAGGFAQPGDATWSFRLFPTLRWASPGGDFSAASASIAVPSATTYTFPSSTGIVADVKHWIDSPAANFGWAIIGNEAESKTARQTISRDAAAPLDWPTLTVDYTAAPPGGGGGPHQVPMQPVWAVGLLALLLAVIAGRRHG